jgi:peroxiredoxin
VERLHRVFSAKGLAVVAVNFEEPPSTVASWARAHHLSMPVLLDIEGDVARRFGVIATPTVILVDRRGRMMRRAVGPRDWSGPAAAALLTEILK